MERLADRTEALKAERSTTARDDFFKACWLLLRAKGDPEIVERELMRFKSPQLTAHFKAGVSAGGQVSGQWGFDLANFTVLAREWVALLSKRTVLGQLATVPLAFNRRAIVETGTSTASFVAGGAPLPARAFDLNATALLQRLKVGFLVAFTNESLEVWDSSTRANIEQRCTLGVVRGLDQEFLDPDAAAVAGQRPGSVLNGVVPSASIANSAASALAGIEAVLGAIVNGGSDLETVALVMHPRTALALAMLQGSNANAVFPNLRATGGDVYGVGVLTSVACTRSGSPSERFVAAIDASRIAVADAGGVEIDASRGSQRSSSTTRRATIRSRRPRPPWFQRCKPTARSCACAGTSTGCAPMIRRSRGQRRQFEE